jgi:TRAP-type C4-dicarboxylate transport system permease small subunit
MSETKLAYVQKKTRRRLWFTAVLLFLYFSFALNWTSWGDALHGGVVNSSINGSTIFFLALIVIFIAMEFIFMAIGRRDKI